MKKSRRQFFRQLGTIGGVLALSGDLLKAAESIDFQDKTQIHHPQKLTDAVSTVDFHQAPSEWQGVLNFPLDGRRGLIKKNASLSYGYPTSTSGAPSFRYVIKFGTSDDAEGKFLDQKLEDIATPVIITRREFKGVIFTITAFATNAKDEGRVDNVKISVAPKGSAPVDCTPIISILSTEKLSRDNNDASGISRKQIGIVSGADGSDAPILLADSPMDEHDIDGGKSYSLQAGSAQTAQPLVYLIRIPLEKQKLDAVKNGFSSWDTLLADVRSFWKGWGNSDSKTLMRVHADYEPVRVAAIRQLVQMGDVKSAPTDQTLKIAFNSGPTSKNGVYVTDAVAIIEALKFAGYDKEAQAGLDQIWDLQNSDGAIVGKGGEHNYKETAAAIYALIRHAELNQDWKSFIELWPDAQKASLYLAGLRTPNGGTLNDKYGLLPRGSVEDDAHGIRAEFTNTLWASIAMKRAWQTSDKLFLLKREEVKQFNVDLILALNTNMKKEERKHPDGFSYVPMYLKDDPAWSESKSKPLPQAALIYLCESLFPGLVFKGSHYSAVDTLALLKAILKDGVPAGTGSSGKDAFEPAFAAAAAQVFLWAAMPELAVTTFKSFLNHASPLYSWGEEQSLHGSTLAPVIGDMPATRAGAECIRFLRNTIVLEDDENLRILNGIVPQDLVGGKKIEASYTPTKWGRVSVSLEQSDAKSWVTKFIREGLNDAIRWPLKWVVMPRKISDSVQLLSIDGAKFYRSGDNILIDSAAMSWQAKWYNPRA